MQRVNVTGTTRPAMADLMRTDGVEVVRQTFRTVDDGYRVQAFAKPAVLDQLIEAGFTVDILESVEPRAGRSRSAEGYLTVAAVDAHIDALAAKYPETVRIIELPHRTWENRTCRAIRIGNGHADAPAILFLGGMHAREWGSPDILVSFAESLLAAWRDESGITVGERGYPPSQLRALRDDTAIWIIPQVNPDGRHHSLTVDPMWRKNRRPAPDGRVGDNCIGVDINRNFAFMWDYATVFSPDAAVSCSTRPCDKEIYVGPLANSEPETRNVVWLLDQHPELAYLVDVHSYGELIMYSWGDDENQTHDPAMSFTNTEWDGRRGVFDDGYREYLPSRDRQLLIRLGEAMAAGIADSRGHRYRVQQSANLYPTAGTSDDYAYSRHLVDPALPKILAFTVEWGSEENPDPFHPPYPEMCNIIAEMTGGLLAFVQETLSVNESRSRPHPAGVSDRIP